MIERHVTYEVEILHEASITKLEIDHVVGLEPPSIRCEHGALRLRYGSTTKLVAAGYWTAVSLIRADKR
jgi:hypothetical protein